ncbi:MAG: SsrA-binding protein SmpB [Candidatus Paceibacteria bacterium]
MAIYAQNRRAKFDYEIIDTYEAGIKLNGNEVKSVKNGRASLKGAFVVPKDGELYLINALIPHYQEHPDLTYDERRSRKLLMHEREIAHLIGKKTHSGLTIIPISLYDKRGKLKLKVALGKGKKKHDKRRDIAERESKRRMERAIKEQR